MARIPFEDVLDRFPLVVSVVTVGRGGSENGLTVSWASPVSFEPLRIMIAIDRRHYSVDFLKTTKNFTLNILRQTQKKLAGHFARESMTGEDKFEGIATRPAPSGSEILTEALAYFDCELVDSYQEGDHLLFIGEVQAAEILNDDVPLTTTAGIHYLKSHPHRPRPAPNP